MTWIYPWAGSWRLPLGAKFLDQTMDGSPGRPWPGHYPQNGALVLCKSKLCGVCGVVEKVLHSLSAFKYGVCGGYGECGGFFLKKSGKWRESIPLPGIPED